MPKSIKKILVANRGEIALRVMRAAREMGIPSVAVYSEADTHAKHVLEAEEAVLIGPPPPLESYLAIDRIIAAAKETGCDAVHPGYGFLAENAAFSQACVDAGLIFIGPRAEAIALLGNKLESRKMMAAADVPVIPGERIDSGKLDDFRKAAEKTGYPVLIKAASGGGGKGMRVVEDPAGLADAIEGASREAKSAFGDATVYLEKYLTRPRHIEFQVMADHDGNTVHVFERECSIQRRHQKIIEETPSPAVTQKIREQMGAAAVKAAQAANYLSAGTVEFLLDEDGSFYFLEVNTRIQVEHPITEMTAGVDLVKEQIKIAGGEPLPFNQGDLQPRGHAIECRIYAEDPAQGFLPSSGKIVYLDEPSGPNLRIDSGMYSGCEVPVFYDPILSKVITWGKNREESVRRMILALTDYRILGIKNNIRFLIDILAHPQFAAGNTYTGFIGEHLPEWSDTPPVAEFNLARAAAVLALSQKTTTTSTAAGKPQAPSIWTQLANWEM
ncbi:acetyl/propionyl/methylcrotonyl-CoA carboxylase subunit alpha [Candidatus Zixiibacteriota bacterium]